MSCNFNPLAPRGARRPRHHRNPIRLHISIHSPLAGRDQLCLDLGHNLRRFQSTRPSRGETGVFIGLCKSRMISIHSPLAGRDDVVSSRRVVFLQISIHSPLAGRDPGAFRLSLFLGLDFNPLAPRGARRQAGGVAGGPDDFNPLAPRGARPSWG